MPDEMQPFKSVTIATEAARVGVSLRQVRRWVRTGRRMRGGEVVKCRGELRSDGDLYTSPAAIQEFLELTREIRRPAVRRGADGRRIASTSV